MHGCKPSHDWACGNLVVGWASEKHGLYLLQSLHDGLDVLIVKQPLGEQLLNAGEGDAGKLGRPDAACCQKRLQDILQASSHVHHPEGDASSM